MKNALIQDLINKIFIKFPKEQRDEYFQDYNIRSLSTIRIALVLGILLYSIFGILDLFIAPTNKYTIWIIRFAIACPALILGFILSFTKVFLKIMHVTMSIISLICGLGIIAMIAIAEEHEAAYNLYYAGLILVIIWTCTFIRLPFIYAVTCSLIVVISYEFTAFFVQRVHLDGGKMLVFINNNFFFISAAMLGMFINYFFENYSRRTFLQRKIISEKQDLLEKERNELFQKNQRMHAELAMARILQQQLIPQENPGKNIFSFYKPMEEVGGDLYDFIDFNDNNRIGIFLSDVSGHGVPAAFITSMIKSIIQQSRHIVDNPAKLLAHLNELISDQTTNYFVTIFYGIYFHNERLLIYANAGHNPPFICSKKKIKKIEQHEFFLPIGLLGNDEQFNHLKKYKNYQVHLPKDSKIILYTDGLTEARSTFNDDDTFEDIIEDKIVELGDLEPEEFINKLYSELVNFRGKDEFDDDICIICANIT